MTEGPSNPRIKFSPEINGLRAVAVIVIIVFHLNEEWLPLGYLGVDIFFVLSGFLITRLILRDLDHGRFKFRDFIERRLKRLFPALFVVLLVTAIVAVLVFSRADHRVFFRALRYAAVQASNFFFVSNTGYFDVSSKYQALLHTWSLGVEEQFYLVWPLLLWLTVKFKGPRALFMTLTIVGSFALMLHLQNEESLSAFYMVWCRAWQFGLGGFLALGLLGACSRRGAEVVSTLGLALMAVPFFFPALVVSHATLFQVSVCLGVCAVIYASLHQDTLVGKGLSLKPLLIIGLISYSLYLWHWPVIVFYNYVRGMHLASKGVLDPVSVGWLDVLVLLGLCFALAAMTYRWVETPFRYRKTSRKKVFAGAFSIMLAFVLLAKWEQDQSSARWRVSSFSEGVSLDELEIKTGASFEPEEEPEDVVLIGDSHAGHFAPMVEAWAQDHGLKAKFLTRGGTPPLLTAEADHPMLTRREAYFCRRVREYLEENPHGKHVIIAAAHSVYQDDPLYEEGLGETIAFLQGLGKRVCLIAQVPPLESSFLRYLEPTHLMRRLFPRTVSDEEILAFNRDYVESQLGPMRPILERLRQKYPGLHVWHPERSIESGIHDGVPCYTNDTHINRHGSLYFVPYFDYPLVGE